MVKRIASIMAMAAVHLLLLKYYKPWNIYQTELNQFLSRKL
jgi:hypothetical protein